MFGLGKKKEIQPQVKKVDVSVQIHVPENTYLEDITKHIEEWLESQKWKYDSVIASTARIKARLENHSLVCCSFCGKSQDKVEKLIAGPDIYICNECIELCNCIIEETTKPGGEDNVTTTTNQQT